LTLLFEVNEPLAYCISEYDYILPTFRRMSAHPL